MKTCVVFLCFLFATLSAHAQVKVARSLAEVTDSSSAIAVMSVYRVYFRSGSNKGMTFEVDFRRFRKLKGEPPEQLSHLLSNRSPPIGVERHAEHTFYPKEGADFVVFFNNDMKVDYMVYLDNPGAGYNPAYTTDGRLLSTCEAILDAVQARAGCSTHGWIYREVDSASDAWNRLHQRGEVVRKQPGKGERLKAFLKVPADPELKDSLVAATRDPDVWVRARATWRLSNYPGDATETLLKALLDDIGTAQLGGRPSWPVRQAAWLALKRLGLSLPPPQGYREDFPASWLDF